jgi:hypothetical protein
MFKMPRAFHVQVVNPLPTQDALPPPPPANKTPLDLVKLTALTKNLSRHAAVTVGGVYVGKKLIDTTSQIALIAAKAKFK